MFAACQVALFKYVFPFFFSLIAQYVSDYLFSFFFFPVLAEDAIRSAIRDYRSKRANPSDSQKKKAGLIDVSHSTGGTATASPSQA